jgi:hypothetical protein
MIDPESPQIGALTGLRCAPPEQMACGVQDWLDFARQRDGPMPGLSSHSWVRGAGSGSGASASNLPAQKSYRSLPMLEDTKAAFKAEYEREREQPG